MSDLDKLTKADLIDKIKDFDNQLREVDIRHLADTRRRIKFLKEQYESKNKSLTLTKEQRKTLPKSKQHTVEIRIKYSDRSKESKGTDKNGQYSATLLVRSNEDQFVYSDHCFMVRLSPPEDTQNYTFTTVRPLKIKEWSRDMMYECRIKIFRKSIGETNPVQINEFNLPFLLLCNMLPLGQYLVGTKEQVIHAETKDGKSEREINLQLDDQNEAVINTTFTPGLTEISYPAYPLFSNTEASLYIDNVISQLNHIESENTKLKALENENQTLKEENTKLKTIVSSRKLDKQIELIHDVECEAESKQLKQENQDLKQNLELWQSLNTRYNDTVKKSHLEHGKNIEKLRDQILELKRSRDSTERYNVCLMSMLQSMESYIDTKRFPNFQELLKGIMQGVDCDIDDEEVANNNQNYDDTILVGARERPAKKNKKKKTSSIKKK